MIQFITRWLLNYIFIMCAMCIDNVCWIPDSNEFTSIRMNFFVFTFLSREYALPRNKLGWTYVWKNRVLEVIKHPRDIIPAIISSTIGGLVGALIGL